MTDYTIKAIPTMYGGRQYRSRLEARWAAFFDLLGWRHEYEPFDLGGWSPDFLVGDADNSCLVEIKPLTSFDVDEANKVRSAALERLREKEWLNLLLLGVAPKQISGSCTHIGWWTGFHAGREGGGWRNAYLALAPAESGDMAPDIVVTCGELWLSLLGGERGQENPETLAKLLAFYGDEFSILWAQATNAVQWRKPVR